MAGVKRWALKARLGASDREKNEEVRKRKKQTKTKTKPRHRKALLALVKAAETGRHTLPGCKREKGPFVPPRG